jgi:hypothetical protein
MMKEVPGMARDALRSGDLMGEVIRPVWASEVPARCAGQSAARGARTRISSGVGARECALTVAFHAPEAHVRLIYTLS